MPQWLSHIELIQMIDFIQILILGLTPVSPLEDIIN